jgi:hypothetical protein
VLIAAIVDAATSEKVKRRDDAVPRLASWIPGIGSAVGFAWDAAGLIRRAIARLGKVVEVKLVGSGHVFVADADIAGAVIKNENVLKKVDAEKLFPLAIVGVFDVQMWEAERLVGILENLLKLRGGNKTTNVLETFVNSALKQFESDIPNLVSGLDSVVDQMPWERVCKTTVSPGDENNKTTESDL